MEEEEVVVKEKSKKKMYLNIITIGSIALLWIVLIILKLSTDFSVKIAIWILAIITIVAPIALFFGKIMHLAKRKPAKEEKVPDPVSSEKIREIINRTADGMMNHIRKSDGIIFTRTKTVNHNQVYAYKVRLLHGESYGDECWMVLNANYPEREVTILPPKTSLTYIDRTMNYKAENPSNEPDTEVTTSENPLLGTSSKTVKKIHKKKEKKKDPQEEVL